MVRKGNLAVFEGSNISESEEAHTHQNWCVHIWHEFILAWIFWANSDRLNFLMTMDYSPWSEREIWPFLKVAISPKPEKTTPTKIGVYTFDMCLYLHEFFEPIPIDWIFWWPWTIVHGPEREIWPFLKQQYLWKRRRLRPPKLVCMHLSSMRLYLHEFFELIPID